MRERDEAIASVRLDGGTRPASEGDARIANLSAENHRLRAALDKAVEALRTFGTHTDSCMQNNCLDCETIQERHEKRTSGVCDCGYSAALRAAEEATR